MEEVTLEEMKPVALDILKRVAKICDDNGFRYVLAFGTLIGAIRNHGFIPWDDDVDIQMPRPDFDKFLKYMDLHKEELGNLRVFNRTNNDKYIYGITRVCNTDYIIQTQNEPDCGMGLFIDVYPLDGIGETISEAHNLMQKAISINGKLLSASKLKVGYSRNIADDFLTFSTRILGKKYYMKKIDTLLASCDYARSNYLGVPCWCDPPLIYLKDFFDNRIKVQFEDAQMYAPRDYDYILRMRYGDYMKLPPVAERVPHHGFVAYKKTV